MVKHRTGSQGREFDIDQSQLDGWYNTNWAGIYSHIARIWNLFNSVPRFILSFFDGISKRLPEEYFYISHNYCVMSCVMSVLWRYSIKFKLIVLGSVEKKSFWYVRRIFLWKEIQNFSCFFAFYEVPGGWKTPIFYIYGHYILSDGCHTGTIFLGMPIFFCYIQNSFRHAFNVWCHAYNLFCYSNYSLCDFTISSAVLWISCLWFIIQPIPTVILELLFHPLDSLCHSCNSACDVHNCFCDPNKIFCHPYY